MKISNKTIELKTKEEFDFIDITDKIKQFVVESQVKDGLLNIQTLHTTAPLFLNENEPLLLEDFKNHLSKLSPKNIQYKHNNFSVRTVNVCQDECQNGHSHCQAMHLPATLTLNIIDGKLQIGQWQRIFLIELDKSRQRKVQAQIIGQ